MDFAVRLIEYLLGTQFSIGGVDEIVQELKVSKDQLLQLINDAQYQEFFQFLHPSLNQGSEKIALTLDLFCCTHYANNCKNQSCPFLHLCPYNIRPMHTKCTNPNCSYTHDILQSVHNRRIIDIRGLSFIPRRILNELIRASANPIKSFWICTDYGKKNGCSKRLNCDKLHYCYYSLTDTCTKSHCSHVINEACLAYFRQKELNEQEHDDILDAFRKVLQQRRTDYINTVNTLQQTSANSSSPKMLNSGNNQRKSTANVHHHRPSSSSKRAAAMVPPTSISSYDDILSSKPDSPPPLPDDEQDILLVDNHDKREFERIERCLTTDLGCRIKLLVSKEIISENKNKQKPNVNSKPLYYYCPIQKPADIFQLLRWQNDEKKSAKPLIIYASVRDAHDAARQNFDNKQFCLFRVHLFHSGVINGDLLLENRLQLKNSSLMQFDQMWIYTYSL